MLSLLSSVALTGYQVQCDQCHRSLLSLHHIQYTLYSLLLPLLTLLLLQLQLQLYLNRSRFFFRPSTTYTAAASLVHCTTAPVNCYLAYHHPPCFLVTTHLSRYFTLSSLYATQPSASARRVCHSSSVNSQLRLQVRHLLQSPLFLSSLLPFFLSSLPLHLQTCG